MREPAVRDGSERTVRILLGERTLRLQTRLDLLDILMDWRPAARLLLPRGGGAETAARICVAVGLVPIVDPSMVWQPRASASNPYVDQIVQPTGDDGAEALIALFVARTHDAARTALQADHSADDERLGMALGYPACCISFVKKRSGVPTLAESLHLYSGPGEFDPLIWPAAALNDAALLPHYPCGIECSASRALAARRLGELARLGPTEDRERVWTTARAAFGKDAAGRVTMRAGDRSVPEHGGWLTPRRPLPDVGMRHD